MNKITVRVAESEAAFTAAEYFLPGRNKIAESGHDVGSSARNNTSAEAAYIP